MEVVVELRHLRYVLALVEHHHFGRAAEALGIKQPPLSQQIQALEAEIGVQLFVRSRQGTEPTAAGSAFAERARVALAEVEAAKVEAQLIDRGEAGRLVIGFLPSAFDAVLPRVLAALARDRPRVTVQPVEFALTTDLVAALRRGTVDFAIGRPPLPPFGGVDDLQAVPLLQDQVNVVLPRTHPLSARASVRPVALSGEAFLITPLEERVPRYWQMICQAAGFEPRVAARVQGAHTVAGMVAAGLGVGVLPQSVRAFATADVVFLPLDPAVIAPPLTLLWRQGDTRPLTDRFLRLVREVLQVGTATSSGQEVNRAYLSSLRAQVNGIR